MVADLSMNLEVVVLPTIREKDELVTDYRNIYPNSEKHWAATILFKALTSTCQLYKKGERDGESLG